MCISHIIPYGFKFQDFFFFLQDQQLIVDEPRKRKQTKRFGNDGDATVEMSDLESDDETYEPHDRSARKRTPHVGPIERAAWTRVECFQVEKLLLVYG